MQGNLQVNYFTILLNVFKYRVSWTNGILLYCFDGVVIAAQCTATFLRSIVLPRIQVLGREYAD